MLFCSVIIRTAFPGCIFVYGEIWFLTACYDIDIFAWHIAAVDNSIANHLSRWHLSPVHHTPFAALTADTPTKHVPCSPHLFQFEIKYGLFSPSSGTSAHVTNPSATFPYSQLQHHVSPIQDQAYAPGTMRNLRSQWNFFYLFCQAFSLVPLPASSSTISSYAVFLTQQTSSYQYILGNLNGIHLLHLYHGLPVDSFTCFEVSLTKKGLKHVLGIATRQKHLNTPAILLAIHHSLDMNLPSHAMTWDLFTVAFFSFLRKSNLVSPTTSTHSGCFSV